MIPEAGRCKATVLVGDMHGNYTDRCELPVGHDGDHSSTLDACEPIAYRRWSAPALPTLIDHFYVSTACQHGLHRRCRQTCKFCHTPCICPCHEGEAS